MTGIAQITPETLKEMLDSNGDSFVLIDVRERKEWDYCRIEGAVLKPLSALSGWISRLDPDTSYIFMCHHGVRSMQAAEVASSHGVKNVSSLSGGINRWSSRVDPLVPRY